MNHPAAPLPLDAEDGSTLEMWARGATAPHRVVSQAKALLMAGDAVANSRIATALGISRPTVLDWRAGFRTEGLDSVGAVRPGRGRKPEITADQVQAIVHSTARHWLAAHPRFELHFTPTGASWLNLVESWFSRLTRRRLRRSVFCSVSEPAVLAGFLGNLPGRARDVVVIVWVTTSLHSSGAGPTGHSFCPDRRGSARGRFPTTCGRREQ